MEQTNYVYECSLLRELFVNLFQYVIHKQEENVFFCFTFFAKFHGTYIVYFNNLVNKVYIKLRKFSNSFEVRRFSEESIRPPVAIVIM